MDRPRRAGRSSRHPLGHLRADACRATRLAAQVTLGDELLVGLDDDAARHAELRRQCPSRGQDRIARQSTEPDRPAQLLLELAVERLRVVAAQLDEELAGRTGPRSWHQIGPYQMTSPASRWFYQTLKESLMDAFLIAIAILAGLIALDVLAVTFGADSRDLLGDDWAR